MGHSILLHLTHIYKGMHVFDWFIFIIVGKIKKPEECWFVFWNYCTYAEASTLFPQRNPLYNA